MRYLRATRLRRVCWWRQARVS
ncbi:hypothetical protein GQ600_20348 [Phytophthora cactorum]|nr:hypothetical protein GQ600_20348 [Phytophthora cactorum]